MKDYRIYPKQFQFDKILVEKNKCFMIMPFDDKFNYIYGIIKEEADKNGVICQRADEMNGLQPIVNKIIRGILESQYIIVDITDDKPNVFYELGISHSFRDARNILILKQKDTKCPFDITHLPYKEYDSKNPYQLKSIITNFIKGARFITDFQDALAINDIYNYTIGGLSNYIEYVEDYFEENIIIYSHILNQNSSVHSQVELENAFIQYEKFITKTLPLQNADITDGIIRIYIKLIEKCEDNKIALKFASRFSDHLLLSGLDDDLARIEKETDLMLALANSNKLLALCLPWIISYFSRSKSSSIDLNRYKLENFLMRTDNTSINNAIIDSVFNEDCHVREHMADIISAKHMKEGFHALKKQLVVEENWFTIGSIVEAIGRIAPLEEGMQVIEKWIDENGDRIIQEKQFFLLKHLQHAIVQLEVNGTQHIDKFRNKYQIYMHENQVGVID